MKIRDKLLVLLLVLAVTPLLFTAFYGFLTVRDMGENLAEDAGEALKTRLARQLELMIQYNARLLDQKQELVEAWLEHLAQAAETALATPTPVSQPSYLAEDFDAGRIPRTQLHPSSRHFSVAASGETTPTTISTYAQVLNLAPGVQPDDVGESLLRLSSLTRTYHTGYHQHRDLFFWLFVSLANGVHSSFPGHGGYPDGYDARNRDWYKKAVAAGDTVWSDFSIDATTRQAVATASRPIYDSDGQLAGVVAIDVPVQAMLNKIREETEFPENTNVFIAVAKLNDTKPELRLLAMLEQDHRDWRDVPKSRTLRLDGAEFVEMVQDISLGQAGIRRMSYQDEDLIWAYNSYEGAAHALVITIPFAEVAEHVDRAKAFVLNQTLSIASIVGVFVLALTGLIIAAAWGTSRTITEPVSDLARAAKRLATGDFDINVPVKSGDEIGQLSSVFNDIAPQLQDRMKARESLAHLGRYFSPNLAQQLTESPELLDVGGERRQMTFVFTDLAGFTALVENSAPEEIMPVLNDYLDSMTRIVWEHEGTIDKVVGDAVHAMFGAPMDQPDHARRGLQCAMAMDRYAESFREAMRAREVLIGITRIGINTGEATVGNFGGDLMFDYTAHGDAINTAARLESANKYFGTRLAISENSTQEIPGFLGRPIGRLLLKGRSSGLMTFEPLTDVEEASLKTQEYKQAYSALADKDPSALRIFESLFKNYPEDSLIQFHLARLKAGESGDEITLSGK